MVELYYVKNNGVNSSMLIQTIPEIHIYEKSYSISNISFVIKQGLSMSLQRQFLEGYLRTLQSDSLE